MIDLKQVIEKKSPRLAKKLPGIAYKLLGKILHLDEINAVLEETKDLKGIELAEYTLNHLNIKVNFNYLDPDSLEGGQRYIFVSNHPLGGLDGLALTTEINRKFGPSKFIVNDILLALEPFRDIFVGVNNLGVSGAKAVGGVMELYSSDYNVINFPAGACSRLIKGKIQDLPWHKSFVRAAIKYDRPIVPIFFAGRNSMHFYRISKIRKALGIKSLAEMILLPDEMFRKRDGEFEVIVGEPILPQTISDAGLSTKEWCDKIRSIVYEYGTRYTTDR